MGYFEGFKTSVEEITADGIETVRKLELKIEPEDQPNVINDKRKKYSVSLLFSYKKAFVAV